MRLLRIQDDGIPVLTNHPTSNIPPYAILSHTWGPDDEEVTFGDIVEGTGAQRTGYRKIQLCGKYATRDLLQYFWVDSCCIDKSSSSELSQAINSMFRWYQNAAKCYVYLSDVTADGQDVDEPLGWESSFRKSRWFTRGWTLQELIAPSSVQFLSAEGRLLGDKSSLERLIHEISGIPVEALRGKPLSDFSRKERLLWAEGRTTKLEEDRAYSLLGIFGVHIPLIYGEGAKNAFVRLEEAMDKRLAFECREAQRASVMIPEFCADEESCLQSLWFPTMNARRLNLESPAKQTCCWLFEHDAYLDWFHGRNRHNHQGLLWLLGKPGTGKSVLVKEAFRRATLQRDSSNFCTASFFFDAKGCELDRSPLGIFRSLLYQLLPKHRGHLQRFCQLWNERNTTQSESEAAVYPWQETELRDFIQTIFHDETAQRTIIFIDALDECGPENARSQAYFWRDITKSANYKNVNLHVCFSSRHSIAISPSDVTKIIMEHCNSQDIATYVERRFSVVNVMADPRWESLRDRLLFKSSGIFLWVVLVVDQILRDWDHGKNMRSLMTEIDRVPEGLRNLFSQLLSSPDPVEKGLTLRLFQWAILAAKPLRLHEWHHIMAFIRSPTPQSLKEWRQSEFFTENDDQLVKQIRRLSKGLIDVMSGPDETRNEDPETISVRARAGSLNLEGGESRIVSAIHESVREFFLEGSGFSLLDPMCLMNYIAHGHLSIMETCLDYLNIGELDTLVLARIVAEHEEEHLAKARQGLDFVPDRCEESSEYHQADEVLGDASLLLSLPPSPPHPYRPLSQEALTGTSRDVRPPCGDGRHSQLMNLSTPLMPVLKWRQEALQFGALSKLADSDKNIDIIRWLEILPTDHSLPRQVFPAESVSKWPTDISVAGQSQPLEDYPALLSYATFELFTHAKLADAQAADPGPVISRLQDKHTWSRWVALREDVPQSMGLKDYAIEQGLVSWVDRASLSFDFPSPGEAPDCLGSPLLTIIPKPDHEVSRGPDGRYHCAVEECTEIPDGFKRRCEWSKHMDKHERPYRCHDKGCEKLPGFTYSGGLLRHEREVHGKHGGLKNTIHCPYQNCKRYSGKGFSRQENLNEHLRRVHPDAPENDRLLASDDDTGHRRKRKRQGSVASFSSAGSHTGNMGSPAGSPQLTVIAKPDRKVSRGPDGRYQEMKDIYSVRPTGNADHDRLADIKIKKELERLEKNKARRQAREQQKELHQKAAAGDAGSPSAGGDKIATGTTRKCANCGQVGHIKTNKKLCPLLNGTMKADSAAEHGGFGSYHAGNAGSPS